MVRYTLLCLFTFTAYSNAFHVAPSTHLVVGSSSRQRASRVVLPPPSTASPFPRFSALHMSDTADVPPDPLIVDTSEVLGRVSWLSWWAQVILTVIASVTLLFARNVTSQNNTISSIGPGFVLAGTGRNEINHVAIVLLCT